MRFARGRKTDSGQDCFSRGALVPSGALPIAVILRPPSRFAGLWVRDDVGDSRARNTRGMGKESRLRRPSSSSSEKPIHPRFLIFRDLPKTSLAGTKNLRDGGARDKRRLVPFGRADLFRHL